MSELTVAIRINACQVHLPRPNNAEDKKWAEIADNWENVSLFYTGTIKLAQRFQAANHNKNTPKEVVKISPLHKRRTPWYKPWLVECRDVPANINIPNSEGIPVSRNYGKNLAEAVVQKLENEIFDKKAGKNLLKYPIQRIIEIILRLIAKQNEGNDKVDQVVIDALEKALSGDYTQLIQLTQNNISKFAPAKEASDYVNFIFCLKEIITKTLELRAQLERVTQGRDQKVWRNSYDVIIDSSIPKDLNSTKTQFKELQLKLFSAPAILFSQIDNSLQSLGRSIPPTYSQIWTDLLTCGLIKDIYTDRSRRIYLAVITDKFVANDSDQARKEGKTKFLKLNINDLDNQAKGKLFDVLYSIYKKGIKLAKSAATGTEPIEKNVFCAPSVPIYSLYNMYGHFVRKICYIKRNTQLEGTDPKEQVVQARNNRRAQSKQKDRKQGKTSNNNKHKKTRKPKKSQTQKPPVIRLKPMRHHRPISGDSK